MERESLNTSLHKFLHISGLGTHIDHRQKNRLTTNEDSIQAEIIIFTFIFEFMVCNHYHVHSGSNPFLIWNSMFIDLRPLLCPSVLPFSQQINFLSAIIDIVLILQKYWIRINHRYNIFACMKEKWQVNKSISLYHLSMNTSTCGIVEPLHSRLLLG